MMSGQNAYQLSRQRCEVLKSSVPPGDGRVDGGKVSEYVSTVLDSDDGDCRVQTLVGVRVIELEVWW